MSTGALYGPCAAGNYYYTAKLANGTNYNNIIYTLAAPATGFTIRNYTLTFYFDTFLNRWMAKFPYVDSN